VLRRQLRWHLNTVCGGSAAFATHVGESGKVRVAILVCQTGGASRFQQTHFLQSLLQLNGFLQTEWEKENGLGLVRSFLSAGLVLFNGRHESPAGTIKAHNFIEHPITN